jgi:hypothetical protein
MTQSEVCHYRGYELVSSHEGSKWRLSVYSTRADVPLLSQSTRPLTTAIEEGVAEAKHRQNFDLR